MKIHSLHEPLVAYVGLSSQEVSRHDQETDGPGDFFADALLMNQISEAGIPYRLFAQMQEAGPLLLQEWADILGLSPRTLTRYSQEDKVFSPGQSAVILRLTEILSAGMEIWGTKAGLRNWLLRETFALGGRSPLSLLTNGYGQDLVLRELNAIEHGLFA